MAKLDQYQQLELQEILDHLRKAGHGKIIDAYLNDPDSVTTRKGRLNKSGVCRKLKINSKTLDEKLAECREILAERL